MLSCPPCAVLQDDSDGKESKRSHKKRDSKDKKKKDHKKEHKRDKDKDPEKARAKASCFPQQHFCCCTWSQVLLLYYSIYIPLQVLMP